MKQTSMTVFWLYIRLAMTLIVLTSIVAAILVSIDLNSLITFDDLFHILP